MSTGSLVLRKPRRGFTLVELAVVVVIIGVLAAFGVPRFLQSVERSKASEAFGYLAAMRSAQERYQAREGTYAENAGDLDIDYSPPKYFDVGTITATEDTWTLTLTRKVGSSGYGQYTVTFNENGYDPDESDIDAAINPIGASTTGGGSGGGS
jgi:prepilin-type N-terminal cleavage/methylation domain-containing protein